MAGWCDKEATEAFERLGHVLKGEVEYNSHGLCCGPSTILLRCGKCGWYFSYLPYTGDIIGDDNVVTSLICSK